jgi:hypothetical protein
MQKRRERLRGRRLVGTWCGPTQGQTRGREPVPGPRGGGEEEENAGPGHGVGELRRIKVPHDLPKH